MAVGRCAELPGGIAGWDGNAEGHGCISWCLASGLQLCFQPLGTAGISTDLIMPSACLVRENWLFKTGYHVFVMSCFSAKVVEMQEVRI